MKKTIPVIHPFMVSSLFVLMSYRAVQPFVNVQELLGAWLVVLVLTGVVYFTLKMLVTERYKAALLTTLTLAVGCYTSEVGSFSKRLLGENSSKVTVPVFVVICILLGALLIRTRKDLSRVKLLLNVTISAMVVATIIQNQLFRVDFISRRMRPRATEEYRPLQQTNHCPDIYYLVFDSYTSAESLKEFWGYDNSPFLSFLETNGFTVVSNAHSNFDLTQRSISTSLNMRVPANPPRGLSSFGAMNRQIENIDFAAVPRLLSEAGYRIINLSLFDVAGTPQFYHHALVDYYGLADVLIEKSLWGYYRRRYGQLKLKASNERIIDEIHAAAHERSSQPRFLYAHVMMPHAPFFYDRNGPVSHVIIDHAAQPYLEQLIYTTGVITNVIADILHNASAPPVIIVQGDHGFRYLHGKGASEESTSILNAYYLPGADPACVPPSITPVNTFRLVFNRYFGADYPFVPNTQNLFADQISDKATQ